MVKPLKLRVATIVAVPHEAKLKMRDGRVQKSFIFCKATWVMRVASE